MSNTGEMPKIDAPEVPEAAKKRRGRPVGSKNKPKGNIPAEAKETASAIAPIDSKEGLLSDAEAGRTVAGVFMVASLGLGTHWRILPYEEHELGRCLGPIFRRYPEKIGPYADLLMCGPVLASVIIPRIGVQAALNRGDLKPEDAEPYLKAYLEGVAEQKRKIIEALKGQSDKVVATVEATPVVKVEEKTDAED